MTISRRPAKYGQPKKYGAGFIYGITRTQYGGFGMGIRRTGAGLLVGANGDLLRSSGGKA